MYDDLKKAIEILRKVKRVTIVHWEHCPQYFDCNNPCKCGVEKLENDINDFLNQFPEVK